MAPIRVGIIGLSPAKEFNGGGTWTAAVHLPALQSLPEKYTIVALANSSVESAKKSAAAHNLPTSVKAYGNAQDLANDPDVDLIVVSVRVGKHYELVKPALLNKKRVLVEWPLAATTEQYEELAQLASDYGVETVVGAQARAAPAIQKLKEILASGEIGTVISSTAIIASTFKTDVFPEDIKYILDFSSGGNEFTIGFGHFLDVFVETLGDIAEPQALLKNYFPNAKIVSGSNAVVDENYPKTAPDHILVQGVTDQGVISSITFRRSTGVVDDAAIRWVIAGTKGEISLTASDKWQLSDKEMELQVRITGEPIRNINLESYRIAAADHVPSIAANVASLYAGFADGNRSKYATFESAAKTMRLLDRIRAVANFV